MKYFLIFVIKLYRKFLSPLLGSHCRFQPTCSMYSMQAIEKYGALKGGWMSVKRISKCHPFNPGGYDPLE
ncbi:membrane protein insertion efficiency factor YidD [Fusibacter tunisiensis]|uniref:Putative membrane protein insertion efficiency factor n=1 Tax=Fusibacter tunisiensis TaxID=1008308 RepID=A0ABS2MNV8_9FIRM|nr:membrane protein insertion efficiency factor YidD [Fusibacter tunisiensis]MBM7561002.1 putative membrane protein insertion efficiency factor [Fusibacter tunisiensis]